MKTFKNILFVLSLLFISGNYGFAQRNFGFYGLQKLPQAHYYNPAFHSNNRVYLSILPLQPSVGVSNSGFTLDDLAVGTGHAIDQLAPLNFIDLNFQNEIFGFGFQTKKRYFSLSAHHKFNLQFAYPKDFFLLAFDGNGNELLGKRANMDGMGMNFNQYMEYSAGYSQTFFNRFTFGSRVKVLSGVMNVQTEKSVLGLTTDADSYALTLDGELDLRTSGLFDEDGNFSANTADLISNFYNFQNFGVAADIGMNFKLNDKWSFNSSTLDVGYIKYKANVRNLVQDEVNYTFDGLDMRRMFEDSTYFERLADSVANIFNVEGNSESYSVTLPTRIIVGTNFNLNKMIGFGATYFSDFSVGKYRPTMMLSTSINLREFIFINGSYMISNRSYNNFGLALRRIMF